MSAFRPPWTIKPTSRAAHASVKPRITDIQREVLRAVIAAGRAGVTDTEISDQLGMKSVSTARTRRKELVDMGLVEDSGDRRPNAHGNMATVWRISSAALAKIGAP